MYCMYIFKFASHTEMLTSELFLKLYAVFQPFTVVCFWLYNQQLSIRVSKHSGQLFPEELL